VVFVLQFRLPFLAFLFQLFNQLTYIYIFIALCFFIRFLNLWVPSFICLFKCYGNFCWFCSVSFEEVHRLGDGQVKHSPEVFYAGSLWKVTWTSITYYIHLIWSWVSWFEKMLFFWIFRSVFRLLMMKTPRDGVPLVMFYYVKILIFGMWINIISSRSSNSKLIFFCLSGNLFLMLLLMQDCFFTGGRQR
jgi:hypothetical protein